MLLPTAGNVFYQILFAQMQRAKDLQWLNWVYFGSTSLSLMLGIVTIVLATALSVWANDFSDPREADEYARQTHDLQAVLLQFYNAAIFLWVFSFAFLAPVNYQKDSTDWTTMIASSLCILALSYSRTQARAASENAKGAQTTGWSAFKPLLAFIFGPTGQLLSASGYANLVIGGVLNTTWQIVRMGIICLLSMVCFEGTIEEYQERLPHSFFGSSQKPSAPRAALTSVGRTGGSDIGGVHEATSTSAEEERYVPPQRASRTASVGSVEGASEL
jgi:hypothetical protein